MTKFEKLRSILKDFMNNADQHYSDYRERENKARAKYSDTGFQDEFMKKIYPEMAGKAWAEADATIKKVNEVLDSLEKDLNEFMMRPINESTAQTLNCINSYGVSLSLNELRILEQPMRETYMGSRIFVELAKRNGYSVSIPTMKEYQDALNSARANINLVIKAYAGKADDGYPGKDLLPPWESRGVNMGAYQHYHLYFSQNYLHEGGELDRLESLWSENGTPMVYHLTEQEEEKVRQGVKSFLHNGEIDKKAAQELIKKEPDFKDKLTSMPDEFFAGKEALIGYFGLDKKEASFESGIDSTTKNAPEYGTKFSKIDPQTLKNFS